MSQPGMSDDEKSENPFFGVAPFNLTIAMTELLALGLDLAAVVATVTSSPVRLLRIQDEIGTLAPAVEVAA